MRNVFAVFAAVVFASGCAKAPVEAPAELADLSLFLFEHYMDEDTAELAAGIENLRPFIEGADFSLDAKDRAVTLPKLDGAALGDLSIPAGADVEKQVPIGLTSKSDHPLDAHRELATEPNRVCIESDTTVWARREFTTDTACYVDGSCDGLEATQETRKENFLAKVWYDQFVSYRVIDVEDADGNVYEALVSRAWIEEVSPGDGGNSSWDQLFSLEVMIPDGNASMRWTDYWSSITLTGIGDDAYANLVIDGLEQAATWGDAFIANGGPADDCNLDRGAEKPARE